MARRQFDERREAQEIKKWLKKPQPKTVSGRYYIPIPKHVWEPMGGFAALDEKYQEWKKEDESV